MRTRRMDLKCGSPEAAPRIVTLYEYFWGNINLLNPRRTHQKEKKPKPLLVTLKCLMVFHIEMCDAVYVLNRMGFLWLRILLNGSKRPNLTK